VHFQQIGQLETAHPFAEELARLSARKKAEKAKGKWPHHPSIEEYGLRDKSMMQYH
jgi:hypothetical protein